MSLRFIPPFLLLAAAIPCSAEIRPAPLFRDGAVLQRERPVPVWGYATPSVDVTVTFAQQSKTTTADAQGRWQINLDALPASSEGRTLTITEAGSSPVEIKNVLVGEVWLCSGQSNMFFRVFETTPEDQKLAASGTAAKIRMFQVPHSVSAVRKDTLDSKWMEDTKENVPNFSAVAYFFGRKISEELKVPVGLIESSWGGARIEPWWAEEGLEAIPEYAEMAKKRNAATPGSPEYNTVHQTFIQAIRDWSDAAERALKAGEAIPEPPKAPAKLSVGPGGETGIYQAMIHPLVPYGLRGFLWYQGEANNGEGMAYST